MNRISRKASLSVKLTLAVACLALGILWPQWRVWLQTLGYYPPSIEGRMTGGGSVFTDGETRVTHGFELHCDTSAPNNLEVNWEGNRFHLTELTSAICIDNEEIDPGQPKAAFDTFIGEGVGRYNDEDGFCIAFTLDDAGEPGKADTAVIIISSDCEGLQDPELSVSGNLDRGNHQAH